MCSEDASSSRGARHWPYSRTAPVVTSLMEKRPPGRSGGVLPLRLDEGVSGCASAISSSIVTSPSSSCTEKEESM
eukprot:47681-Eustigmatos_ZCMA.PRE.1